VILRSLGAAPADWDFLEPEWLDCGGRTPELRPSTSNRLVYLDDLRSPYNVGSVFRTAESFGVEGILLSRDTPLPTHPRAIRSAMGCADLVEWSVADPRDLDGIDGVFALEVGGTPLDEFRFPRHGCVIVGNEELGISPVLRRRATEDAGIVSIPTAGRKGSLNAASAFAILMYCWSRGGAPAPERDAE
jgi:TrmH family RNA methyltransferase